MGLLNRSDWSAKWIGTGENFVRKKGWPPPDNTIPDPWLRKVFSLPTAPERSVIYVASIGYHELFVNGRKVGDAVLSPSVANLRKRARYVTYEITSHVQAGKNVLGLWLGLSWSIFPHYKRDDSSRMGRLWSIVPGYKRVDRPQSPLVLAQAEFSLPVGPMISIATDATWKTHPSPNTLLGVWDFQNYGGELYDARRELQGWCEVDLDDSDWRSVKEFSPEIQLSAEMVEPNRIIRKIDPVGIQELSAGEYRVDMGTNFTGWIEADLRGKPGDRINVQFSEREEEPITHRLRSAYILGPEERGTFRNRFNYNVGRWVQINGLRYKPSLEDVRGYLVRTDYRRTARFECSNPLLNQIYETTLWTFENLSLGGYVVDCPHRERMGYGGDALATTETGLSNYDLGAFYTKWSEDWRDVQGKDGNLPYSAPTYWGAGGPAWSGYAITLPWELYRRYGDVRILEENFPTMKRWLTFLETKASENLLIRWGGKSDFLGDWLWPGAQGSNGDTRETLFFNNCYWIYNLTIAARVAHVLEESEIAARYRKRADAIRRRVHSEFFKPEERSYVNGFQAYLAIALLVDLPPQELRAAVWKRLEEEILVRCQGHVHAGITGGAMLFKALLANDRADLILEMATRKDYPGWGNMLGRGATTWWEDWDRRDSLLHSSYLYIGSWFGEALAGIQPDPETGGFKNFIIKPAIMAKHHLDSVSARYESLHGLIESEWRTLKDKLELRVSVPANTTATVFVPASRPQAIQEGKQELSRADGVQLLQTRGESTVLLLLPGRYYFEIDRD